MNLIKEQFYSEVIITYIYLPNNQIIGYVFAGGRGWRKWKGFTGSYLLNQIFNKGSSVA